MAADADRLSACQKQELKLVALHFDAHLGKLPPKLVLRTAGFDAVFGRYRAENEAIGRRVTLEGLCNEAGIHDRVARRARKGERSLPRYQVQKLAEIMGCALAEIVEIPDPATAPGEHENRCRTELANWPVPLQEVSSWTGFVGHVRRAHRIDADYGDEVVELNTAAEIQTFMDSLGAARAQANTGRALAVASLKDAERDLLACGLHILFGRYVGRAPADPTEPNGRTGVRFVLVVRIRKEVSDLSHVIDRTAEPLAVSDEEDFYCDDTDWCASCLEWEGKDRLALYPAT